MGIRRITHKDRQAKNWRYRKEVGFRSVRKREKTYRPVDVLAVPVVPGTHNMSKRYSMATEFVVKIF